MFITFILTWKKSNMWAPVSSKQLKHTSSLVPCHVFGTMFILPCAFCPRKGWHEEVENEPGSIWITFEYFKHYSSHFKCMSQEWNGEKMFVLFSVGGTYGCNAERVVTSPITPIRHDIGVILSFKCLLTFIPDFTCWLSWLQATACWFHWEKFYFDERTKLLHNCR